MRNQQAVLELRRSAWAALAIRRYAWGVVGSHAAPRALSTRRVPIPAAYSWTKRLMDIALTLASMPVAVPLLLLCAMAVKAGSVGPVFVPRLRTGIGGRRFRTWHLRTTVDDGVPGSGERLAPLGQVLRSLHLDVLPELLSVVRGDMSLVGPRPNALEPAAMPLWYTGRFEARPGLTGLAQIAAERAVNGDEAARLDIAYVRTWTLRLDAHILYRSVAIGVETARRLAREGLDAALDAALGRAWPSVRLPTWQGSTVARALSVPGLAAGGLFLADIGAIAFALALAGRVAAGSLPAEPTGLFLVVGGATVVAAWLQHLYQPTVPFTLLEETVALAKAVTLGAALGIALAMVDGAVEAWQSALPAFWLFALALTTATHATARRWLAGRRRRGLDLSPAVVVGSPSTHLLDRLRDDPAFGLRLIGFLSANGVGSASPGAAESEPGVLLRSAGAPGSVNGNGLPRLGSIADAPTILAERRPERVVIIEHGLTHSQLLETIDACERHEVPVQLVPPIYDLMIGPADLTLINGVPSLRVDEVRTRLVQRASKRAMDILASIVLLLLLAPVLVGIAIAIRRTSPGPALFRQVRGGRHGRPFNMLKFRTMVCDAEARLASLVDVDALDQPVFKVVHDPRITPVGRWLRRFSLDELPQLMNVLKGDMSLVGPRPEELRLVEKYDVWQRRRLKMKPGITGLQQVVARGHLADLRERVRLDIYYTRKQSVLLDFVILFRTVGAVLSGRGAT